MDHGKLIALGTPRELVASLGAEHVVEFGCRRARCPTSGARARCPVSATSRRRGRRASRSSTSELHLHGAGAARRAAPRAAPTLTQLSTHSATLEDVFVSLTGRHLRDA